jgi:hypothetical protein
MEVSDLAIKVIITAGKWIEKKTCAGRRLLSVYNPLLEAPTSVSQAIF